MSASDRQKGRRSSADDALALAVAAGDTLTAAAKKAGVSESTARRRAKEPAFAARVQELRAEIVDRSLGLLVDGFAESVAKMRLLSRSQDERVALAACRSVLEFGMRVQTETALVERIAEMERALGELKQALPGGGTEKHGAATAKRARKTGT